MSIEPCPEASAASGLTIARCHAGGDPLLARHYNMLNMLHIIRLDYLSCVLTVLATVLIGKKLWQGWVVAALNSAVVCVIGVRTAQFGFVPANLLCIALYTSNLVNWRPKKLTDNSPS
jgi:hypothetical protein